MYKKCVGGGTVRKMRKEWGERSQTEIRTTWIKVWGGPTGMERKRCRKIGKRRIERKENNNDVDYEVAERMKKG